MPTEADHIALANKNDDVLQHLMQDPERFPEWIVTTSFYKAVQVVEAVFANHGQHGHDHNKRLDLLKTPRYAILFRDYRPLWTASSVARYLYDNDARVEKMGRTSRNIGEENLQGLRELKRGEYGRVINIPDIATIRQKTGLSQARFA